MAMMREVVIRLDDVRDLSPRLEAVWSTLERHGVPVHLGAIPADITAAASATLVRRAAASRATATVQQHGFRHVNHGTDKRKFEFDDSRSASEQREDLLQGRAILEHHFGTLFDTVFVPPWDRCGAVGLEVLADAGFAGISVIETSSTPHHPGVPRVAMTTDPVQWKPVTVHKPWDESLREVQERVDRDGYAGIELHHEIMDEDAVRGLDLLLAGLRGVSWPTMREVADRLRRG